MQIAPLLNIGRGVTALIGGGGKTTLLYTLTEELRKKGHGPSLHLDPSCARRSTRCWSGRAKRRSPPRSARTAPVCVGEPSAEGKLGPPSLSFDALARLADYVLVEADGSRRLPLKAHAPHEPVIPANAQRVVLVVGAGRLRQAHPRCLPSELALCRTVRRLSGDGRHTGAGSSAHSRRGSRRPRLHQ